MALLYLINKIYHIPESKIGMYIPNVIGLLLKMEMLILRRDSEAAWKKMQWVTHSNYVIIIIFFGSTFTSLYYCSLTCLCVWMKAWKESGIVGRGGERYIKIDVMIQRAYSDLTEGHCSPAWVSASFFLFPLVQKYPLLLFLGSNYES